MVINCSHCGIECGNEVIHEGDYNFCCHGCQGVFHLLKNEGLEKFYAYKGENKLSPIREIHDSVISYDEESFLEKYTLLLPNGEREVSLILEGIHCIACVWLNEKVLERTAGITLANVNFTTNKAKIRWNPSVLSLSAIIQVIRSIGYNAHPYDASLQEKQANNARKEYYNRMIVAIFATMNIMWIAIAQYAGYFTGIDADTKTLLTIAEWFLATPTLFYSGFIFYRGAYYGIKNSIINMDFLVSTGATLAYLYSLYVLFSGRGESYFDSVTMIITFVLVGKFLEVLSKKNAVDALDSLSSLRPTHVNILKDNNFVSIPVSHVKIDDIIEIKAGDYVALDGVVVWGEGNIDESKITGEPLPVFKTLGSELMSGSFTVDTLLRYRVTRTYETSLMSRIIDLLENALIQKPRIEQQANQLSVIFSSVIVSVALLTFIGWFLLTFNGEKSLTIAISVLVIACPCALALATPMASLVGIGIAVKKGIVFKSAFMLEELAQTTVLCIDKTGTLTQGKPHIKQNYFYESFELQALLSLSNSSTHPLSRAIKDYCYEKSFYQEWDDYVVNEIKGRGVEAVYQQELYFLGGEGYLAMRGISHTMCEDEGAIVYFGKNDKIYGYFLFSDELKDQSREAIERFKAWNYEIIMLTGDREHSAKRIANELNIHYLAGLTPLDKESVVTRMQNEGKRVIMVGDGLNDVVALAKANIGIAFESGASLSVEVSDVAILSNSLKDVAQAVFIARETYATIRQNLLLSLVYNGLTIPLAVLGYIIPLFAALSMSASSLLVVGNSLRIKKRIKQNG